MGWQSPALDLLLGDIALRKAVASPDCTGRFVVGGATDPGRCPLDHGVFCCWCFSSCHRCFRV
eukprot:10043203-Prorocentrum_lima.AAC.1